MCESAVKLLLMTTIINAPCAHQNPHVAPGTKRMYIEGPQARACDRVDAGESVLLSARKLGHKACTFRDSQ